MTLTSLNSINHRFCGTVSC